MTEHNLVAKPIVKDQYWIVTDGIKKVGNIEANVAGYGVQLNGIFSQFDNTEQIKKSTKIIFTENAKPSKSPIPLYSEFPTTAKVYNSVMDVKRNLHLYSKSNKSKSLCAAGWFVMNQYGTKCIIFCPKYIFIQRYEYVGPFKTKTEAEAAINTV